MHARMMSILRQSRTFENRMYGFILEDLPESHPAKGVSLMQLKVLFEIYRMESISRGHLSESVGLPICILKEQLGVLEKEGLTVSVISNGKTVYCIDEDSLPLFEPLEQRLNLFVEKLGFRVGEMALVEWDQILKIVNKDARLISEKQRRPEPGVRDVSLVN